MGDRRAGPISTPAQFGIDHKLDELMRIGAKPAEPNR
jgi:hypothetical protein